MMKCLMLSGKISFALAGAVSVSLLLGACAVTPDRQAAAPGQPQVRHIILFVADGWGYNHMEAASIYQFGWRGGQVYQDFPIRLAAATYPYGGEYDPERAWTDYEYLKEGATDSAAGGTAMSTGHLTENRRVGIGPDGRRLKHLAHVAQRCGMAAGVVVSVPLVDATPTTFAIYSEDRWDHEDLGRQMIEQSGLDLLMGTGHPLYDENSRRRAEEDHEYFLVGGQDIWHRILAGEAGTAGGRRPWRLVEMRDEFLELIDGEVTDRILGIPRVRGGLQYDRDGNGDAEPFEVPFIEGIPTLEQMTRAALNVLSQQGDGFFVMVEGGAIDWAGHHNNSPRLIEEHVDFDNAVQAAVDWVEAHSSWNETLIIVTSDHECGYLLGPGSGPDAEPMFRPVEHRGKGVMPGLEWHSDGHTNKLIPFFARGIGAEQFREHIIDIDPERGPYLHIKAVGRVGFELLGADWRQPAAQQTESESDPTEHADGANR